MARARNIKPGFYANEDLAECSVWARLIFPGLWMMADREGRLEDRPKKIKGELLRFDSVDAEPLLAELQARGFITRYTAAGTAYIQINNFSKHQTPHHREPPSAIPPPSSPGPTIVGNHYEPRADDGCQPQTAQGQPQTPPPSQGGQAVRIPDTGFLIPDTGCADSAPTSAPKRSRRKRAHEMPAGFDISDRVRQWAQSKGFDRLQEHFESFCSKAKSRGYVYVDWDEALMCAIRDDWAGLRVRRTGSGPQSDPRAAAARSIGLGEPATHDDGAIDGTAERVN